MADIQQYSYGFDAIDYVIFALVLLISLGIGLYHACVSGEQRTTKTFFLADRRMNTVPVALSILVSFISGILVLGTPAEMYTRGTQLFMRTFGFCIACVLSSLLFVPLFFNLKLTSSFESVTLMLMKFDYHGLLAVLICTAVHYTFEQTRTRLCNLIWFESRANLAKVKGRDCSVRVGSEAIEPSTIVRVLGVHLDDELSVKQNIGIGLLTSSSSTSADEQGRKWQLAFVTSRLDYCNSLLTGLPLESLQRVQNVVVQLTLDHVTLVANTLAYPVTILC